MRLRPNLSARTWRGLQLACLVAASGMVWGKFARHEQVHMQARQKYGESGLRAVQRWESLLSTTQGMDHQDQIRRVNAFFNHRIDFMEDTDAWGQKDYWATPLETLARNRGDCEDFSIAKYMTLLLLGIPENQLRITYVKARIGGPGSRLHQAHMVLDYYPDIEGEPVILDNLVRDIHPASGRPDLEPIFSFNSEGLWFNGDPQSAGDPTAHLSRWRDVLARMRSEGFE
jgi:predicted transglutaminase-like cysteine proteinase